MANKVVQLSGPDDGIAALFRLQQGPHDCHALVGTRQADIERLLEPAGAEEGIVNGVGPVGSADDPDTIAVREPVELGQKGIDDAGRDLGILGITTRDEGIEFVKEYDARDRGAGAHEEGPNCAFGLADVLARLVDVPVGLVKINHLFHELGTLDADKVCLGLGSSGFGEQSLTAPWRTPEQHTGRLGDVKPCEP